MRSHRHAFALALAMSTSAVSVASRAQAGRCPQQSQADALEDEGRALRDRQNDAEAIERFRAAYALCRGARALARLGLAETSLGLWVEADRDLSTALTLGDRWVRQNEAAIRRTLDDVVRARLGQLELIGDGPRGELFVNGRSVGAWPRGGSFPVVAGTVTIEVRAPSHENFRRSFEVPARTLVREQVRLVQAASTAAVERPLEHATAEPTSASASERSHEPLPSSELLRGPLAPVTDARGLSWQVPAGWTAVALAAAGVGVGIAGVLHAQARRSTYDNDARCSPRETDATYCASIIDGVDAGRAMTIAGFVSGGVLAVLGTVLLVTAPSRSGGRAWACAPAAGGGGGLTCAVRF